MRVVKLLAALVVAVALTASCTTRLSKAARQVQLADDQMVLGCTLLGVVSGSSGWGNLASSKGQVNARNEAQERAARLGATHLVWIAVAGGYSPSASARAYKCGERTIAAPNQTPAPPDLEVRLAALKRALEQGLITKQEYDEKRRAIIDQF